MNATYLVPLLAVALIAGCASEPTCDYAEAPYMSAQSVPSLKAPEGLSAPDRSASLTIPALGPDAKPAPTGKGRCLDRPPSYFATGSTSNPTGGAIKSDSKEAEKK